MSWSCEELTKLWSLCTKYEVIVLQNSNDVGFCDRIYKKKLKKDPVPFRQTYGSLGLEKIKDRKKIVGYLEPDDLFEPIHSDWAGLSLLVPKKECLVVRYRGLNKQIEKTCWLLP